MIYYPIQTLVNAGITDIMVVTGGNSAGDFLRLLGNGKAFGLKTSQLCLPGRRGRHRGSAITRRTFRVRRTGLCCSWR